MHTPRLVVVVVAAAVATLLGLSACGGSDDEKAGGQASPTDSVSTVAGGTEADDASGSGGGEGEAAVDVCALVDIADAEKALDGLKLRPSEGANPDTCTLEAVDETRAAMVIVTYQTSGLEQTAVDEVAGIMMGVGADPDSPSVPQAVDSIDGALALDMGGMPTVLVPHGDDLVSVSVVGGTSIDSVIGLAEMVAGNL